MSTTPMDNDDDLSIPLWKYVKKLDKLNETSGNVVWQCNFCKVVKTSSYTGVKAHLLILPCYGIGACQKVTKKDLLEMQKLEDEAKLITQNRASKRVPLPSENMTNVDYYVVEENKRKGSAIEKAFNMTTRDQLDSEIARMWYSSGLPFNLARNPHYVRSYSLAANCRLSGYLPPGYNKLRTTLLQKERKNVERLLQPIKGTWMEKGVTIVSDGWSDPQRRPLINFMAVTESGPMFLKAVDCSGETKDKYFISNLMKEVINEVGHEKVVQVITDNAPNCKGAGQLIELDYPHIFWTPYVVHTLNLALKNICAAKNVENNLITFEECNWITSLHDKVMIIKKFIMNHSKIREIFHEFVPLKLLSVAETRFASVIVMLKRFKLIQSGLQEMVISESWASYRDDDVSRASFVKTKILDDLWWDSISYVLSFTSPIYDMIRFCDTDKPSLHLVYDMWDSMIEKVKGVIYRHEGKSQEEASPFYDVVHRILVDRWNKNNTPLHCLSHSLNPRYYSEEWLVEDTTRVPPHRDVEVSRERMKCFKRYLSNEDRHKVIKEYSKFSMMEDDFSEYESIYDRYHLDPKTWWVNYGACAPTLQTFALKLLGQPSSSSCCERNWSTYSFVHSLKRNKLTPKCAEDLVFVYSNLRLLSRSSPHYSQGETKMWDVGGDAFDSFEDGGMLEVTNLSLDEPELEAIIFRDDENGNEDVEEAI